MVIVVFLYCEGREVADVMFTYLGAPEQLNSSLCVRVKVQLEDRSIWSNKAESNPHTSCLELT